MFLVYFFKENKIGPTRIKKKYVLPIFRLVRNYTISIILFFGINLVKKQKYKKNFLIKMKKQILENEN